MAIFKVLLEEAKATTRKENRLLISAGEKEDHRVIPKRSSKKTMRIHVRLF